MMQVRVGEQSPVVWKFVYRVPASATRWRFGVGIKPPKRRKLTVPSVIKNIEQHIRCILAGRLRLRPCLRGIVDRFADLPREWISIAILNVLICHRGPFDVATGSVATVATPTILRYPQSARIADVIQTRIVPKLAIPWCRWGVVCALSFHQMPEGSIPRGRRTTDNSHRREEGAPNGPNHTATLVPDRRMAPSL